jgi:lipoic acid synthetase
MGLAHVVVTSVTRDDLEDGGAGQFVATMRALRAVVPGATVELLVPDLGGDDAALRAVLAAGPDVLGHNLETVPRLYDRARPQAAYDRSLAILRTAAAWARPRRSIGGRRLRSAGRASVGARPRTVGARPAGRPLVKTSFMLGLGESPAEVDAVLRDCVGAGVDLVTIGQYLQPDARCLPVARYATPEEFADCERRGGCLGLTVRAAPFVRSSYRAGELLG